MRLTFLYRCTRITGVAVIGLICFASPLFAEERAGEHLYGAPSGSAAVVNSSGGSISQVTLALAIVLAFVFVAAWLLRSMRKMNFTGATRRLEVIAHVSLGAKERAVLVRVNNTQVLIGVAPGHVAALHTFAAAEIVATGEAAHESNPSDANTATSVPSFKALLKKSLGLP